MKKLLWVFAFLCGLWMLPGSAWAVACSGVGFIANFGEVSPVAGIDKSVTTNGQIQCNAEAATAAGEVGRKISVCIMPAAGNRILNSIPTGLASLSYTISEGATAGVPPGSTKTIYTTLPLPSLKGGGITPPTVSVGANIKFYSVIPGGQFTTGTKNNQPNDIGTLMDNVQLIYKYWFADDKTQGCDKAVLGTGTIQMNIAADATQSCNIQTTDVDFGKTDRLNKDFTAEGAITVNCAWGARQRFHWITDKASN